jgi:hypothetical protein
MPALRIFVLLCVSVSLWFSYSYAADIPSISDADLQQALTLAGDNRAELQRALALCVQQPYMMQAQRFVIASLPLADLGKISKNDLTGNLVLAVDARATYAYGQQYDDATFAHYVLPPRVSQEPLSDWRSYFYSELKETVRNSPTLELAAVEVNKWCGAHARFQQTQSRDQGPLATLASGYGRCEELCILLIDACRAVGVPARMAYCPWWAVQDNNHAWVEVYGSDGRWHYCGGAEPAPTLDSAWFGAAVKSAPIILSPCFGLPGEDEVQQSVLSLQSNVGARYCLINSTSFYRHTGSLEVAVPLAKRSSPAYLNVRVFNYGALRSVAKLQITSSMVYVQLGAGDYVLEADLPDSTPQLVHIKAGQTTGLVWGESPARDSMILAFPADQT